MNKIVLTTILPNGPRYVQLGLYNLKAYSQAYKKLNQKITIDVCEINPQYIINKGGYLPSLNKRSFSSTASYLMKNKPKIIGFSCFKWNITIVLKLASIIKKLNPNVIIILGGPEVSIDTEELLNKEKSIDMIVRDEGEETFLDILRSIFLKELNLIDIKGLTFRVNNKITKNSDREPMDLSKIHSLYLNNLIDLSQDKIMTMETSRGCSFRCAYCSFSIRTNHMIRFFPTQKVKKEMNKKDILKARLLRKVVNLLYNKRFLKKTMKYLIQNSSIQFTDILEEWSKEVKFLMKDKKYLRDIQHSFVKHLITKYKMKLFYKDLKLVLDEDMRYYLSNQYNQSNSI